MAIITLATYAIEVHKRDRKEPELLSAFDGRSLGSIMRAFLKKLKTTYLQREENNQVLNLTTHQSEEFMEFGILEAGVHGYSSELYNIKKKIVTYKRGTDEAEMLPFFFLFYLPEGKKRGLIIFQRFGTFGVRSSFALQFQDYFREAAPEYAVRLDPVIHPKLMEQLVSGGIIKKIRFRQRRLPSDICERYNLGKEAADDAYTEYSIVAKKRGALPFANLLSKLSGKARSLAGIVEDPPHYKSDQVLLDVSSHGMTRRIDIGDLNKIRSYYDVTSEVTLGKTGHPQFKSILEVSKKLTEEIWNHLEGTTDE